MRAALVLALVLLLPGCVSGDILDVENQARHLPLVDAHRLTSLKSAEGGFLGGAHAATTILAAYPAALDAATLARAERDVLFKLGWDIEQADDAHVVATKEGYRASCETGVPHDDGPEGVRADETVMRCVVTKA